MAWTAKQRQWRVQQIRKRDGFHCWLCGEVFRKRDSKGRCTIDHAIPKARGGTNHLSNLRLAHEKCNQDRGMIVQVPPRAARIRLENLSLPITVLELTADMIVGSAELEAAA